VTSSPIAVDTSTVSPDLMNYSCIEIADQPPPNHVEKGVTVFNTDGNLDAFMWNNDTKDVYRFSREEGDRLWGFNVSPDGKHIVYMHSNASNEKVVVATADGKTVWSQITDSFLWNWFDNERLVNLLVPKSGSPSLILLNPFSGERQELRADYPNSEMFSNEWYARWRYTRGGLPIYDPMLTRVIYPQTRAQSESTGWPIVLWDTKENKIVRKIETMDYWGETPIWMPDGKQFIIAANMDSNENPASAKEFFAVNRDGEVKQLTHFKEYYQEINILDNYSLSPNGKLLAFWISAKPSQFDDVRLAVLNIENGDVTNYCIKGDPFLDIETTPPGPIWSPDSTQLLVVSRNPQDAKIRRIVLMDLVRNYAAQIAEDVEPVGWMTAP
jgi:Tol biopolymer transport system component